MYGMEYQKALKSGIIVATLLVTVSLATQQQSVYSSSGANTMECSIIRSR